MLRKSLKLFIILAIGLALGIYHDSFNDFVSKFTTTINSLVFIVLYILFLPILIALIFTILDTIRDTYKYDIVKLRELKCNEIYSKDSIKGSACKEYNEFATQEWKNLLKIKGASPSCWNEKLAIWSNYFYALLHLRIEQLLTNHRKWIDIAEKFMNIFKC